MCFRPNLQHIQDPKTGKMSLVAQRKIKKGEELAVTYINHFQGGWWKFGTKRKFSCKIFC